jgi:hypothetical protein
LNHHPDLRSVALAVLSRELWNANADELMKDTIQIKEFIESVDIQQHGKPLKPSYLRRNLVNHAFEKFRKPSPKQ